MKIRVNEKQLGYYGFENSANAVIVLDVSGTNVQLPKMNISFTNLIKLHASYNGLEHINDIGKETFPSLKFLNLSHNAIASVKSHLFSHLTEIEILDLSHNCFVHFNYDHVLLKHENLKKLYLHDNLLHKMHAMATVTSHLLHMELMDLSRNFIEDFNDLNIQIKELRLTNNSLGTVTIQHANEMKLLAKNNQITSFTGIGSFSFVDLSFNEFKYLSQVEIKDVKVLLLSHNSIEKSSTIESGSDSDYYDFSDTSEERMHKEGTELDTGIRTEILDLSFNKLENMEDLKHFSSLKSLNLKANKMNGIDLEHVRKIFPHLSYVNFMDNPLTIVDIAEMKFHNHTRFLNMHIDYDIPAVPETSTTDIIYSTDELQLNTEQSSIPTTTASTTCTGHDNNNIIMLKGENTVTANKIKWHSQQQYWTWIGIGVVLVIAGFIVSIIYKNNKQRNKTQMRYMNREFNEAENFF